jgi:hypothetical protein
MMPSMRFEHCETLAKYFFPLNLTKDQTFELCAPLEEMKGSIERTPELIQDLKARNVAREHQGNLLRNVGSNINPMDDIIELLLHPNKGKLEEDNKLSSWYVLLFFSTVLILLY